MTTASVGRRPRANAPLPAPPGTAARAFIATGLLTAVALGGVLVLPPVIVGAVLTIVSILYITRKAIFSWTGLLVGLLLIVLFVPVRRIQLAIPLPFALEPYRIWILIALIAIFIGLLVDPKFVWRKSTFGGAIAIFLSTLLLSIAFNIGPLSAQGLGQNAVSAFLSFVFMFSTFFVVRQLLRSPKAVSLTITTLVLGGAIVGAGAAWERVSGTNIFLLIGDIPGLELIREDESILRSGGARSFGSAQHPIALAVLLATLLPLAVYQARHASWPKKWRTVFWSGCAALMGIGMVTSVSRTGFIVVGVMVVVAVICRPGLLSKLATIGIPFALLAAAVAPGVVINMIRGFLDPDDLIASQYAVPGTRGSGRLADVGPTFAEASLNPLFGTSVGSRIVVGDNANAFILDNQVLSTLLESGAVGVLGLFLLFILPFRKLVQFGGRQPVGHKYRDLATALAVTISGYFTSLFFFDAFGFLQSLMLFMIILAIGSWVVNESRAAEEDEARKAARRRDSLPAPLTTAVRR